jgi:hypothetical protein
MSLIGHASAAQRLGKMKAIDVDGEIGSDIVTSPVDGSSRLLELC